MADFTILGSKKKKKIEQMGKIVGRARKTGFFFPWPKSAIIK